MRKRVFAFLLLLVFALAGCESVGTVLEDPTEPMIENNTKILPKNYIQFGDSFEYYPQSSDGHFECSVTDVQLVTEQSQCPAEDKFLYVRSVGFVDGEPREFEYDEWFTEGGAFDLGTRLVLVDLTVTNVDAVAWLDNGTFNGDCGYFRDEYAFAINDIIQLMDLTRVFGEKADQYYHGLGGFAYFSRAGEFEEEDILDTIGHEKFALKILPGETISFTVGYLVDGSEDGKPRDFSTTALCVVGSGNGIGQVYTSTFIDPKLGEE